MRGGFTLVEMIIVIGIAKFLSALLLTYNHSSDNQLVLGVEEAKVVGFLNRAKSFALERNLAKGGENVCGFGVNFDKATNVMTIFRAAPTDGRSCDNGSGAKLGDTGTSAVEFLALDTRVEFRSFLPAGNAYDVVFQAPYLAVVNPGTITLGLKGGTQTFSVDVRSGGDITAY